MSVTITKFFRRFLTYSSKIIEHYETPRNVGSLPKNDKDVGVGLVGAR